MFEQLKNAAALGFIKVQKVHGGYAVHGARGDLLLEAELEAMGAAWDAVGGFYIIPMTAEVEALNAARAATKATKAAAVTLAARAARARKDGLRIFDAQRKQQQKKAARAIREAYELALYEHRMELDELRRKMEAAAVSAEDEGLSLREYYRMKARSDELESVIDALAGGLAKAGESAQRVMNAQLPESAAISRRVQAWQIDNAAGIEVSRFLGDHFAALASTGVGTYHGKYDLKAWQGVADRKQCREAIRKALTRGLLTGEHPSKMARRFEGLFTGSEPLSPHARAVRIARTETNRVMNEAAQDTYRAANAAGVKVRNRWDATLDSRTRESHKDVDGEIREVGEEFSNGCKRPGDGGAAESINCRCCLVPIVEGFTPDAPMRRDNERGELIRYMTYREWELVNKLAAELEKAQAANPTA